MAEELPTEESEAEQVSESEIAVHWREEGYYYPSPAFIAQANAADPQIFERFSEERFPDCFKEYADLLTWDARWQTMLDSSNPPFWKWFVGGRLNASYNCVDRHLAEARNKAAIIWVPEPEDEDTQTITYQELYWRVNEFAGLLRDAGGVQTGDRVTFYLPMIPELPVAMLACARLGAIHCEVFGGFSGAACRGPARRLRQPHPRDRGRVLPQRRARRPQGPGRRGRGGGRQARSEGRQGARVPAPPGPVRLAQPDGRRSGLLRRRAHRWLSRQGGRTCLDAGRGAALPHVHERDDGAAEGVPALDGRIPGLRGGNLEVLRGHPPGGHLLVHRGHRLDHGTLLHRLRASAARDDDRHLRGRAHVPGSWPGLADRRAARREHLPHRADDDPDAAQARTGRAGEVQLPLQAHDNRRRTDRARGVALVPRGGRQGGGRHRRHVVADGERRVPRQHAARGASDEARQLRTGGAGHLPRHLRRGSQGGAGRKWQGGQHLHPQSLAGALPDRLGPAREVRRHLLREVLRRQEQQGLARLAVPRRRWRGAGRRRLLPDPRAGRRRHQRRRAPARDEGDRVRRPHRGRGLRGGCRPGRRRGTRTARWSCTSP